MNQTDTATILQFTFVSYAAVFFFVIGLGLACPKNKLSLYQIFAMFGVVALSLHFILRSFTANNRIFLSFIWWTVICSGIRFGKRIARKDTDNRAASNDNS